LKMRFERRMVRADKLPRIGAHLGVGKGLKHTADQVIEKGLESLQIFLRNPRGGKARELTKEEVGYFKERITGHGIKPVVVHIPYVCNPAAVKEDLYRFALEVVKSDLERCDYIDADFLVLHPGSYTNSTLEAGIERVAGLLNRVLKGYEGKVKILLETMSGQGKEIGQTFEELQTILQLIKYPEKLGICFDTCHVFASGYDCSNESGINSIIGTLDKSFGRNRIHLVHANDSMRELGSKRDRHAHIGKGFIGVDGFKALMKNDFFKHLPFILETPAEELDYDIKILKEIRM
jgi:deoxyribonuclease-4